MNKKNVLSVFIIIIILLCNVDILQARVNAKKDTKTHPKENNEDPSPQQKNGKGLAKGKSKKDDTGTDQYPVDPPTDPVTDIELDVYSDYECTVSADKVDWGEIEIGGTKSIVLYIKNNGNLDLVASLVSENWYPEASREYMTLGWDYGGQIVSPGEVVGVTLTLAVSLDCPLLNDFNFDVVIIGS